MPERSTMKSIFCARQLIEIYKDKKRNSAIAYFIDLEMVYDSIPREILQRVLKKKENPMVYIKIIKGV